MMSFRTRPGSGLSGRGLRPLTMVLDRIMSGRSFRPDSPDEVKRGSRDPVLALPRLGGWPPSRPRTGPGPLRTPLAPSASWRFKHFVLDFATSTAALLWGYLRGQGEAVVPALWPSVKSRARRKVLRSWSPGHRLARPSTQDCRLSTVDCRLSYRTCTGWTGCRSCTSGRPGRPRSPTTSRWCCSSAGRSCRRRCR